MLPGMRASHSSFGGNGSSVTPSGTTNERTWLGPDEAAFDSAQYRQYQVPGLHVGMGIKGQLDSSYALRSCRPGT